MKNQKGIALITLAIAILAVMVLAGIIVSYEVGSKSPVNHMKEASELSFHDNVKDALLTLQMNYTSKSAYITFLKNEGYLYDDNQVNVAEVLDTNDCQYGAGENKKDVYILTDKLILQYYNKEGESIDIADLGATMEP